VARHRLKRADLLVDEIKRWIVSGDLRPGDRFPNEAELQRSFSMSKGTVREALKALELQGLVTIKTGPKGGPTLSAVPFARSFQLLQNYFFFQPVDLDDIYAMRRLLEPELAAIAAVTLSDEDLSALEANIHNCCGLSAEARGAEDLEFHDILARACPNTLMGLQCQVLNEMLRRLVAVSGTIPEMQILSESNLGAHRGLLDALRQRDAEAARKIMSAHIAEAESHVRQIGADYRRGLVLEHDFNIRLRMASLGDAAKD
jgi:DNA-binding FadR family transcriptional regulator